MRFSGDSGAVDPSSVIGVVWADAGPGPLHLLLEQAKSNPEILGTLTLT